jgi:hydrogenase expression/formation protein
MGEFGVGSRGAGGGTISTAALYYQMYDVLDENITFVEACEALFAARLPGNPCDD